MSTLKEFKEFAMKGNIVDLAIGVVIGAAFGAIVNSLVTDIITPIIGMITGGIDFSGLNVTIGKAVIAYGKFLQATFSFLIIAFTMFMVMRMVHRARKEEAVAPAAPPAPTTEEKLLTEIRDLLKK
jgi:large conductance mechanosensitive channel